MKILRFPVLLLFPILICLSLIGCHREEGCPDYQDRHYYISDEEQHVFPYTGHDTLTYKRTVVLKGNVDTITFIGRGTHDYIEYDTYGFGAPNCEGKILKHSTYTDYITLDSSLSYKLKTIPNIQTSSFYINLNNYTARGKFNLLKSKTAPFTFKIDNQVFDSTVESGYKPDLYTNKVYYNKKCGIVRMEIKDSTEFYQLITK